MKNILSYKIFENYTTLNFKVGDIVVCINDDLPFSGKIGDIYKIKAIDNFIGNISLDDIFLDNKKLKNFLMKNMWHHSRFRLATPSEIKKYNEENIIKKYNL